MPYVLYYVKQLISYGCECRFFTLREIHGLRMFKNKAPRKIFSPKWQREDSYRKPHSEGLHDFYSSPKYITRQNTGERDG